MASYRGHLAFSSSLAFIYGGLGHRVLELDLATSALGVAACTVGGLVPDLDSDSGVPIREMFQLAAVVVPLMLVCRLSDSNLSMEEILVFMGLIYCGIRYGLSRIVKRLSVHRGMFHSIPTLFITGFIVYLGFHHPSVLTRSFLAVGAMVGCLSHLVLDEIYSVNFSGIMITFNAFAGSALKFKSKSWKATLSCYAILGTTGYFVYRDLDDHLPGGVVAWVQGQRGTEGMTAPQIIMPPSMNGTPFSTPMDGPPIQLSPPVPSSPRPLMQTQLAPTPVPKKGPYQTVVQEPIRRGFRLFRNRNTTAVSEESEAPRAPIPPRR